VAIVRWLRRRKVHCEERARLSCLPVGRASLDSLPAILTSSAVAVPERPALVFRNRPIPFAELGEWVRRTAAGLQLLGVRGGDRVAILAGNVPEFVYAFFGTLSLGGVAVPLDVELTPEDLGYILADCGARVVAAQMNLLPPVLAIRDRVPSIEQVLVMGPPPTPRGTQSFDELLDRSVGERSAVDFRKDDLAMLTYTAGSTVTPRGVMLTHGNLLAALRQYSDVSALSLKESDVALIVLPLSSRFAHNVLLGTALEKGATVLLVERFDPEETLALIQENDVTALFGTPAMFRSWLEAAESRPVDLASVRLALSTLAPAPPDVVEEFRHRFGQTIWSAYGLPEAGSLLTTTALGTAENMGSIGLPAPGLDVRLVGERGEDVENGDPGEIIVRGPSVSNGYWNSPEQPEAAFVDGWFRTGDLAYRDEEGYLFLVGRKIDVIRVSGFNVFPSEVESVLMRHPKVAACTVSGMSNEQTGEAVKAVVTLNPGESATEEELLQHCRGALARFKCPTVVEFREPT
jgi:long-chain acyl-CoA synthetase